MALINGSEMSEPTNYGWLYPHMVKNIIQENYLTDAEKIQRICKALEITIDKDPRQYELELKEDPWNLKGSSELYNSITNILKQK